MFDDFDTTITCEEYYNEEDFAEYEEPSDWNLEMGFDPYAGEYTWDC